MDKQDSLYELYLQFLKLDKNKESAKDLRERGENFERRLALKAIRKKEKEKQNFDREIKSLADGKPYIQSLDNLTFSARSVESVLDKRRYNEIYAEYYHRLFLDTGDNVYFNTAESIGKCYLTWFVDSYNFQSVRDVKNISLCHSKFCSNCQSLLQAVRFHNYLPILRDLIGNYDLYHLTLTVPNVPCVPGLLSDQISVFMNSFRYLSRLLQLNTKIKNIDFAQYGYMGAIRSLEITIKSDGFHPHFHCLLVLKKGLNMEKKHINKFSFDHGELKRKFSDFEILIQKVWYLIYNKKQVKKDVIDKLSLGYSCTCDLCEGEEDYKEVFKYVTKLTKEDGAIMTYEQFRELVRALYKRRGVQSYGCLYNVLTETEEDKEIDRLYKTIVGQLQFLEKPVPTSIVLNTVGKEIFQSDVKYISKSIIQRYVNEMTEDEKL